MWSLGATLYDAVEGHSPYGGTGQLSAASLLVKLITEPMPEPRHAGRLTPVLAALVNPDPALRPSAQDAAALLSAVGDQGAPITTESRAAAVAPSASVTQTSTRSRTVLLLSGVAGALVTAAIVVAAVLLSAGHGSTPRAAGRDVTVGPTVAVDPAPSATAGDAVASAPNTAPSASSALVPSSVSAPGATGLPFGTQLQVSPSSADCVAESFGDVQKFLAASSSCQLTRALYSADVGGRDVTVSVAIVRLGDPTKCRELVDLATSNGTGDVRTLIYDGDGYPGAPATWASDPTFYATVDADGDAEILEAMWSDTSIATHENDPALMRLLTGIAPSVAH